MDVKGVYLGYNFMKPERDKNNNSHKHKKEIFHLMMVKLYGKTLTNLNKSLRIKTRSLKSLYQVSNDLTSEQRPFSINHIVKSFKSNYVTKLKDLPNKGSFIDYTHSNNYTYKLITKLFTLITNKPQAPLLRKAKNLLDPKTDKCLYKYVVYVGYKTNKNGKDSLKMIAIFPFKSNFIFHRRSILGFINIDRHIGNKVPNFKMISNNSVFQLPINNNDDIANFYKTKKGFKLDVYKPLKFDDLFNTDELKYIYADTIIKKFTESKVLLTSDNSKVEFVKSENDLTNDVDHIEHEIFKHKRLLNSMSMFTGNKNNAIQKISSGKLKGVLKNLKSYPTKGKPCNFKAKNVPKMSDDCKTIYVTADNLPIFCSLLKNKVVKRVLTDDAYVPYYNEVNE